MRHRANDAFRRTRNFAALLLVLGQWLSVGQRSSARCRPDDDGAGEFLTGPGCQLRIVLPVADGLDERGPKARLRDVAGM